MKMVEVKRNILKISRKISFIRFIAQILKLAPQFNESYGEKSR